MMVINILKSKQNTWIPHLGFPTAIVRPAASETPLTIPMLETERIYNGLV